MDEDQDVLEMYSMEELRANCKALFGIEKEVFDGVFYGYDGEMAKEIAKEKIENWLGKEVEQEWQEVLS